MRYDREQQMLLDQFEALGQMEPQMSVDLEEVKLPERLTSTSKENGKELPLLKDARGILRIEQIDLEMIIFNGATPSMLDRGTGIVDPQKEFGINNVGLAGHRALVKGKQFNRLDELKPDDVIEVTTHEGDYEFKVIRKFVVPKTEVSVLDEAEKPLITLITCTPLGRSNPPDRLIVQAELKTH